MTRVAVALLALVLLAAPLAAEAQGAAKALRVGWLHPQSLPDQWVEGFRQGVREHGYVEDRDFVIERRWGDGKFDRLPAMAADLVRLNVDVVIAGNSAALRALQQATRTIPVVMVGVNDPVALGFVASLARPGGNFTGLSGLGPPLSGKRLELLREVAPGLTRITAFSNPKNPSLALVMGETRAAATSLGLDVHVAEVLTSGDLERVFADIVKRRSGALVLPPETVIHTQAHRVAQFAITQRLPSISAWRDFADAGGLMAYGVSIKDLFRRSVGYIHKIHRGVSPADLPVEDPTKFELIVNLKTAKALGLTIPQSVLLRADEVIE
jgi:putative ABC transport system substrate-binding protein